MFKYNYWTGNTHFCKKINFKIKTLKKYVPSIKNISIKCVEKQNSKKGNSTN